MTSFFQSIARHPGSALSFAGCAAAFTGNSDAAQAGEAEYHVVFASTTAALIGAGAVVITALSHAF
jgi:hypothetical protein